MEKQPKMNEHSETLSWLLPEWQKEVVAWCATQLAEHRVHINGAVEEVRMNPWSTVLRVPTTAGSHYFKACVCWRTA